MFVLSCFYRIFLLESPNTLFLFEKIDYSMFIDYVSFLYDIKNESKQGLLIYESKKSKENSNIDRCANI